MNDIEASSDAVSDSRQQADKSTEVQVSSGPVFRTVWYMPRWAKFVLASVVVCLVVAILVMMFLTCTWPFPCSFPSQKSSFVRPQSIKWPNDLWNNTLQPDFVQLLRHNPDLFLLEPALLSKVLENNGTKAEKWNSFSEHMGFSKFDWNLSQLTIGVFDKDFDKVNFGLFALKSKSCFLCPEIYQLDNDDNHLKIKLLKFQQKNNYFITQGSFSFEESTTFQSSYDLFSLVNVNDIHVPDDIGFLLSQMKTSEYFSCNINTSPFTQSKEIVKLITGMKKMMQKMRTEFWLIDNSLKDWAGACKLSSSKPIDGLVLATWFKPNVTITDLIQQYKSTAREFGLSLYRRCAKSDLIMVSFKENQSGMKSDLHFRNFTNDKNYCSTDLIGYKMQADCYHLDGDFKREDSFKRFFHEINITFNKEDCSEKL